MDVKKLKELLSVEQIHIIMTSLGATYKMGGRENEIMYSTICHGGDSHKLYFFKDSKEFFCYSNCGHLDIINIVQQVMGFSVRQAVSYICNMFGLGDSGMVVGFYEDDVVNYDIEIINMYQKTSDNNNTERVFNYLDKNILGMFYKMYHPAFYKDGISIETLHKFDIRYDILEERIIIPHLDEEGNLIAIRCRNLKQALVDEGRKYMPITFGRKLLSAKTSLYLYGLYYNKENIKKAKRVILLESEKAVMQLDSILGDNNIGVALSSSSLSVVQVELLRELDVEEVVVALDKEFEVYGSDDEKRYAVKIRKGIINKLMPYFNVSVIWDTKDLLQLKDSPTDKGKEVFYELFNSRIRIER